MKKTKIICRKLLSLLMIIIMLVGVSPTNMFVLSAKAIEFTYNPDAAIAFAKSHCETDAGKIPNDTDGTESCVNGWLCAEFVAECLLAGGFPKKLSAVAGLGGFGGQITDYGEKITCTKTGAGYVKMSTFSKTLSKGTPIVLLYGYGSGSGNGHVVIYSGETESDGTLKVYGHNNRNQNGKLYSIARTVEIFAVNLSAYTVTSKPTNLNISANYTSIGVGDTVTFTYSIKGATNRCIGIDKNGTRYKSLGVNQDSGTTSYTFTEPGTYCCIVEGSNSIGYSCSSTGAWITVVDSKPTNLNISSDYTSIGIGDTVTFDYSITGATNRCIGIDKNGTRYKSLGVNQDSGTASYTFTEPGTYCCIVEGSNSIGYSCSSTGAWITVVDSKPTNLNISSDYTSIGIGDTVTFDYSITGATNRCIGIDKNGTRYKSLGVSQDCGTVSYTFTEPGTYCCIIEGSNSIGYSCSSIGVWITVSEFYSITYDTNGGSNAPASQTKKYNENITLSSTTPTRDGYTFLGWATDENATVPEYFPGDVYSENKDLTLYAVWEENKIEVGGVSGLIHTSGSATDKIVFEFAEVDNSDNTYIEEFDGNASSYSLNSLTSGKYILKISKENHVTREYEVTIGEDDVNLDVQINLIGDINGDGKISVLDYTQLLKHVKKTSSLDSYAFDCADVNGDGKLTILDYTKLLKHVKKTETLW